MYHEIMVPVDLSHLDKLVKALNTAIDMAKRHGTRLHYVTVTNSTPGQAAHNPKELAAKMEEFAEEQGKAHGIKTDSMVLESVDTAVELDDKLIGAIKDIHADLVVMASHPPGLGDKLHLLRSNGAEIVKHTDVSVFIVR